MPPPKEARSYQDTMILFIYELFKKFFDTNKLPIEKKYEKHKKIENSPDNVVYVMLFDQYTLSNIASLIF